MALKSVLEHTAAWPHDAQYAQPKSKSEHQHTGLITKLLAIKHLIEKCAPQALLSLVFQWNCSAHKPSLAIGFGGLIRAAQSDFGHTLSNYCYF